MCRSEGCSLPPVLCPAAALPADMPSHQLTQPMKPRLPRKLAASARINLNKYWHALEELMPVRCRVYDESDSNAINENIDNERRLAAMQLCDDQEDSRKGPSGCADIRSKSTSPSGKKSASTSFPRISSASSFPRVSDSFLKLPDSSFSMTLDIHSGDENIPPVSNVRENSSR